MFLSLAATLVREPSPGALAGDDEQPQQLLSQGRTIELDEYLDDAQSEFVKGGR